VFVSAMASISGLVVAAWGVSVVTRLHADESGGRLEQVLATGTSRRAVLLAPTLVALAGVLPALALVGVSIGVSGGDLTDAVPAALVQAPAVAVVIAVAALGQGLGGRWTLLAWGGVVVATAVGQVGAAVGMPEWLQQASPFTHVPKVPADAFELVPEVALLAVAAVLVVSAVVAVGRRDVPR
jgi:ABC-2 type transport system permease protein